MFQIQRTAWAKNDSKRPAESLYCYAQGREEHVVELVRRQWSEQLRFYSISLCASQFM